MGIEINSFENEEDILLAMKKSDIQQFINGKQNINVKVCKLSNIGILPKKIENRLSIEKIKLTAREKEVLSCVVQGKNNVAIAKELSVSRHTVKAHVASILQKMEVSDRYAAAIKAMAEKIV